MKKKKADKVKNVSFDFGGQIVCVYFDKDGQPDWTMASDKKRNPLSADFVNELESFLMDRGLL